MKDIVKQFFYSWCNGCIKKEMLSDSFNYKSYFNNLTTEEWIDIQHKGDDNSEAKILKCITSENEAALLFEFSDNLTDLVYVYSWYIAHSGQRIDSLIEARQEAIKK